MPTNLSVVDQIKNGQPQGVAVSQTAQVVSNVFQINAEDAFALLFQVRATAVGGTAGVVKPQHSIDNVNWADVDATNAKVTLTAAGYYPLILNGYGATLAPKMPLFRWLRFVCTTTAADTCTLSSILVQLHVT